MDPPSIEQILISNLTVYQKETMFQQLHPNRQTERNEIEDEVLSASQDDNADEHTSEYFQLTPE